ncbi:hypothetical protein IWGMT90018_16610 [Mycobacterium kiyosense]|nr:hypothetical protein IWGMT90018_16610 [Mycobacterium kiyosense]
MLELKVNMILCSPGLLMALAEMSETYGVDVRADLSLRCLLTTGEMCTDSMKALLEETWGATAYDFMYGSQEAGVSIRTNPDGSLVPVQPTYLLEVLDLDTGKTLGFEGYGELCLTTLIPGIKPLIRYRTGDLVEISRSGSGSLTVRQFGRAKDMVDIGGHKRTAAEIENEILVDPTLVYGYELEIQSDGGQDRLLVRVKAKNDADKNSLKALIAGRLTTAFGVPADVEIHPLLDMRTATGAWVSWKTARVKDVRIAVADEIEDRSAADLARAANEAI